MLTYLRNAITSLYNTVTAPVATTRDALAERLQSVRETAALLYKVHRQLQIYGGKLG